MKKRMLAGVLTFVMCVCLLTTAALAAGSVASVSELEAAAANGGSYTLSGDLMLNKSINVTGDLTLDLGGHTISVAMSNDENAEAASAFSVAAGGSLTLKNGKIAGDDAVNTRAISAAGSLTLEDMKLYTFVIDNGSGGAVYADHADVTITGCTFWYNENTDGTPGKADQPYYGGGSIYMQSGKLLVSESRFLYVSTYDYGGALFLDSVNAEIVKSTFDHCEAYNHSTMPSSARGGDGGAIYARLCPALTLKENQIINGFTMGSGAGLYVIGDHTNLTLEKNTISGNQAGNRGGGMKLVLTGSSTVSMPSGTISNNEASWGGGIDYTTHKQIPLQLTNVLITENKAVRGAGIWACPTSKTEINSTLGGAIYGNTASGSINQINGSLQASGDEVRYEGSDYAKFDKIIRETDPNSSMTVLRRALGGGLMEWYRDEADDRYETGDQEADPSVYTDATLSFGLHGELSADSKTLAEGEARLIIKGNTASSRGGGIATNSPVIIGLEGYNTSVHVTKVWPEDSTTHPDSILVDLYLISADGTETRIETVALNKENNWSHTFSDLPAKNTKGDVTYTVKEQPLEGWTCTTDVKVENTEDGPTKYTTYTITLTNKEGVDGFLWLNWLNTQDHYSYLIGYSDGTVRPEGKITRAEVATIFFRLLSDDTRAKYWSSENDFSDVPADKWYNNAVSTLSHMGVIGGYADGTFRPDAPISRAEFAKIAVSFSQNTGAAAYNYFTDVKTTDWFAPYVTAAKDGGLIEGYSDGSFKPENKITRAEACAIVNRTLGRKPSKSHMKISDRIDWPDCTTADWFYEAIMEATNSHTYQMGKRVETWNDKLPQRDWAALETGWANAYTGNGGEVR